MNHLWAVDIISLYVCQNGYMTDKVEAFVISEVTLSTVLKGWTVTLNIPNFKFNVDEKAISWYDS